MTCEHLFSCFFRSEACGHFFCLFLLQNKSRKSLQNLPWPPFFTVVARRSNGGSAQMTSPRVLRESPIFTDYARSTVTSMVGLGGHRTSARSRVRFITLCVTMIEPLKSLSGTSMCSRIHGLRNLLFIYFSCCNVILMTFSQRLATSTFRHSERTVIFGRMQDHTSYNIIHS